MRFHAVQRAWIQWTKDAGKTFEDVPIDAETARKMHSVDDDGQPVLTYPFIRFDTLLSTHLTHPTLITIPVDYAS